MAKRPTLSDITTGHGTTTKINANFDAIEQAFDNTLSRDGSSPNAMEADLDMNSNQILNLPDATTDREPLTYRQYIAGGASAVVNGFRKETQTATASQTVFTATSVEWVPGIDNLIVFVNGELQGPGLYTVDSSTQITFTSGLTLADRVDFVVMQIATTQINTTIDAGLVSYNLPGTSFATNVETKLREFVSVKDFGAIGDGIVDDTTVIQAAINYAASLSKTVYFPSGSYYIAGATLTVPDNVKICGIGKDSVITIDASVRSDPNNDHIFIAGSNTIFKDLTIDGDRSNAIQEIRSIFIDNEDNVFIDNITFSNHGVAIWTGYTDNIKITNCNFTSDTSKVHIVTSGTASGYSSNLFIQNNFFGTTVEEAIDVNDKTRSVIIDSNSFFNNHTGTDIDGTEVIDIGGTTSCLDFIISNNRVNNNNAADAFVWAKLGSERVVVSGNIVTNLKTSGGSSAVRISNSKDITVIDNTVVNATRLAILQERSSTVTSEHINISQNTARNISGDGIFIDTHTNAPKDIIIDGNTFTDLSSSSRCIYVVQADKIVVSNNVLSGFGNDGISLLANCVNAIVSGNVVNNCSDALSIASPSCVISGNNCSSSNVIGLRLSAINCTVNGNIFNSNSSDGIALAATSDKASVTGNVCTGNTGSGINVAASTADAVLVGNVLVGNTTSAIANAGNLSGSSVNANNAV